MIRSFLLSSLTWLALAFSAQASTVLPLYLDEIVADAAVAFQGICTDNRTELDPATGLVVTYTTFAVTDVLKGAVGATHTIKQMGGRMNEDSGFRMAGIPTFTVASHYVVFLYGVSRAGFSSPVGLSQGKFMVRRGAGAEELSNGRDFREMLRTDPVAVRQQSAPNGRQEATAERRHMNLDEFKQLVRQQNSRAR